MIASIYALKALKNGHERVSKQEAQYALRVAMIAALILAPLQIVAGDSSARFDARHEPEKLAAMEGQFKTQRGAPLRIGGLPDSAAHVTRYALEIPYGLSFLATGDPAAIVRGLDSFAQDRIPNPDLVHPFFQIMAGFGFLMTIVAVWWLAATRITGQVTSRPLLWAITAMGPGALLAMESGWMVTEEGRQPWSVRGYFLVSQSVTPAAGVQVTFAVFTVLYVLLGLTLLWLLMRIDRGSSSERYHAA